MRSELHGRFVLPALSMVPESFSMTTLCLSPSASPHGRVRGDLSRGASLLRYGCLRVSRGGFAPSAAGAKLGLSHCSYERRIQLFVFCFSVATDVHPLTYLRTRPVVIARITPLPAQIVVPAHHIVSLLTRGTLRGNEAAMGGLLHAAVTPLDSRTCSGNEFPARIWPQFTPPQQLRQTDTPRSNTALFRSPDFLTWAFAAPHPTKRGI